MKFKLKKDWGGWKKDSTPEIKRGLTEFEKQMIAELTDIFEPVVPRVKVNDVEITTAKGVSALIIYHTGEKLVKYHSDKSVIITALERALNEQPEQFNIPALRGLVAFARKRWPCMPSESWYSSDVIVDAWIEERKNK